MVYGSLFSPSIVWILGAELRHLYLLSHPAAHPLNSVAWAGHELSILLSQPPEFLGFKACPVPPDLASDLYI